MAVLDASALLAFLNDEPGADAVSDNLDYAKISAANFAEVVGKVVDAGRDISELQELLDSAGIDIEPLTADDAEMCGALRTIKGGQALSLGDRCCLALTLRTVPPVVLTTDRAWSKVALPLRVQLIR